MSNSSPSVTALILIGVAAYLIALAILFGAQWIGTALVTALMHRRYPSLSARRAYLLRGMADRMPTLTDTQRLEKIRVSGKTIAFGAGGLFVLLPSELVRRWLGLTIHPDWPGHAQLLWAGFGINLAWVALGTPWIIARGKLAREALETPAPPLPDPAGSPPTFWPNLRPVQPE